MDTNFEQMVRERAYAIWMATGQTDGMAVEHWCSAEAMVRTELAPAKTDKPAKAKAASVTTASAKQPAAGKAKKASTKAKATAKAATPNRSTAALPN